MINKCPLSAGKKQGFIPDFPDSPEKELFVWAVLFNRRELAKLFWRMSKDHIGNCSLSAFFVVRLQTLYFSPYYGDTLSP